MADKIGDVYVMVKDIEKHFGNTRAIALYNPSDKPQTVDVDLEKLELGGKVKLRDLINRKDAGAFTKECRMTVPAHGVVVLKAKADRRLERVRYEGECGYISDYQELVNNAIMRTPVFILKKRHVRVVQRQDGSVIRRRMTYVLTMYTVRMVEIMR